MRKSGRPNDGSASEEQLVHGSTIDFVLRPDEPRPADLVVPMTERLQVNESVTKSDAASQIAAVENPEPLIDESYILEEDLNDLPLAEQLAFHEKLLVDGWRPSRWLHPTLGEAELVVSDGFWKYRYPSGPSGVRWGVKNAVAAIDDGRPSVVRNTDGHLIAVPADPNTPKFRAKSEPGSLPADEEP